MSKPGLCTTCIKRRRCLKHFIVWLLGIAKYVHSTNCYEPEWKTTYRNGSVTMDDCSKCKFSEEDYIFDEEIGDEYPIYTCSKGNDTSLDYECEDFKEYKPKKYKEKDTKCDKCEHLEICLDKGNVIDCRTVCDTRSHYIADRMGCVKNE
jgi:hypothetical protein|nr:MAG TPA: hypothetical protein [Bacteriophage sp.]